MKKSKEREMNMEELKIIALPQLGSIQFNEEEVKAGLAEQMKVYKELPVSAENKADRKKDIATLRKMKKAVDDRRKEVKSIWMKPYDEFERKVKEVMSLIDEPINLIDDQVKELEDRERRQKKAEIREYFSTAAGEYTEWLTLEQIYDPKWENASVSLKKVREEIDQRINEIKAALASLSLSVSDVKEEAIERYKPDLNLTAALAYINQYEAQRARIQQAEAERRQREQEQMLERERQRIREDERRRAQEEQVIRQEARREVIEDIKQPISDEVVTGAKVTAVYTVSATPEEMAEIETALDSLGIAWERKEI